jgi:hypothetical protein
MGTTSVSLKLEALDTDAKAEVETGTEEKAASISLASLFSFELSFSFSFVLFPMVEVLEFGWRKWLGVLILSEREEGVTGLALESDEEPEVEEADDWEYVE